jgi:hypothetical protein
VGAGGGGVGFPVEPGTLQARAVRISRLKIARDRFMIALSINRIPFSGDE